MRINRVALVSAMTRADLNVTRLAEKAKLSCCTISAVKAGKSCSKETAEKLAAVLGADIIEKEV